MPVEFREIDRRAAIWVERMNRPVQSSEMAADFDRWIMSDPRHVESYARMQALWQSDGFDAALAEAEAQPTLPAAPNDNDPLSWAARNRILGGGVIAALLCLIIALPVAGVLLTDTYHYQAPHGDVLEVALKDGSTVMLSSGTAIDVRLTPWSRQVDLLSGEAFFDVAHEQLRGFDVDMGEAQVTVLGTAFDIDRSTDETLTVTVFRGVVGVDVGAGRQWRLPAGSGIEIAGNRVRSLPAPMGDSPGWIDGWYDAANTPVSQLIERLNRRSELPVRLEDAALGDLQVSGRFQISKPEAVLDALALTYDLNWQKHDDYYAISR
ncbi:FecR family protein [Altericroceibacterium endophyticum]|uniref:DUF4880 domain-containing protein n=1 Tax=Altericroceibacterium endophyticum TaxID=1808508 RepID=A0A6I4TAD9_9SPHN|nr:FecR domain-containing protein [Altericroceibacterium endophyticum]MXO67141.1 DUF4880 domain-containing protein [Altericroceibacterium endophyticum]